MTTSCPVTDIKFVLKTDVATYTAAGYKDASFNDTTSVVYSQTANSLPVTSTLVQYKACFDSFYQSNSPGKVFYEPEFMKAGCQLEKNTNLMYDPRYVSSGLHINQDTVYNNNGVGSLLYSQPDYLIAGGASVS